jgi:outer membrane protein
MVIGVAASGMLLANSVMAADQKIAVVNFQEIMGKLPQTAALMQSLEAEFKDEKAVITQLEKDIKYYQEKN